MDLTINVWELSGGWSWVIYGEDGHLRAQGAKCRDAATAQRFADAMATLIEEDSEQ